MLKNRKKIFFHTNKSKCMSLNVGTELSYVNSLALNMSLLDLDFLPCFHYKMKVLLHFVSFSRWKSIVLCIIIKIFLFHSINWFTRTKSSFRRRTSMCLNDFDQYYMKWWTSIFWLITWFYKEAWLQRCWTTWYTG